jgi:predicted short-subunit dehydrogenase-like oxidoreductase (DUF2520 family)
MSPNSSGKIKTKSFVFHTSGALSSETLNELKKIGCRRVPFIRSFQSAMRRAARRVFAARFFASKAKTQPSVLPKKLSQRWVASRFRLKPNYKTLYHAAAVTACGHLVALLAASFEMIAKCGLGDEQAKRILLPLIKSTIENLEQQTPAAALTGTFARADTETFVRHLETLEKNVSPEILELYLLLVCARCSWQKNRERNPRISSSYKKNFC